MNQARRKELSILSKELSKAKNNEDIQTCIDALENIRDEEQEYFDNMPENLQGSMRGMDSENAIDNMESALDSLNDALDAEGEERSDLLEEAIGLIDDAQF